MDGLDCANPKCREDLLSRMGQLVTKTMAWLLIATLVPICFTSLLVALRVWGVTEFYAINQIKVNTIKLESLDTKFTKMDTYQLFIIDRLDKQLDRIKKIENDTSLVNKEIRDLLNKLDKKMVQK